MTNLTRGINHSARSTFAAQRPLPGTLRTWAVGDQRDFIAVSEVEDSVGWKKKTIMEPHSHADYERVLTTVAELLDRLAESDLAARVRLDGMNAHLENVDKTLATVSTKLDEATDKINGLIDLMNRHVNEPHPSH